MIQQNLPGGVSALKFSLFGDDIVQHFISTRQGGASGSPFQSLNLSFKNGDQPECVSENRTRLFRALGVDIAALTTGKQVHGDHVEVVSAADRGRGSLSYDSAFDSTDALITRERGACLMVVFADCAAILLHDPIRKVIGIAHAGWRGVVSMLPFVVVAKMGSDFGCEPDDIRVGVGPCIGASQYLVGQDVADASRQEFPYSWEVFLEEREAGQFSFDILAGIRLQLLEAGINENQIEWSGLSSFAQSSQFFSRRRDGWPTGACGAGIVLT